ncbi:hypothetical protein DFH05DRAFT_1525085 [Lentinula detonsa]|uniref:Uncharacterized protein n=1 Tax=Lentinula detonsa TaxID=2804962 RepID=A0A9W8NZV0_9AGAR|nr:hypothetical protein DFH05DRAFT_1525085 [Lentinula detonsa]
MSSTTHPKFFQRGRINARDLIKQDLEFIQDYATRYSISKTLTAEEIVHKIFESRQEFIPILPNHTWALEDDRIVLTERREPPAYPRYQSLPSNPLPLGDAFPEPPEDTFSRSPSPSSEEHIEERPSRLPLVYPPVGLGDQPVPDDWLQQMFEEYQENHETVVSELEKLVEEIKNISYETVRAMSKVRKEQSNTWHLLDTVKEVCGSEFVDKLLRDIHVTTRFEINRKLRASGIPSETVLPTADDEHGGTIRSKKFTRDKQIFGMSGGSMLALHEGPGPSQPSNSQVGAASSMEPLVEASIPEQISAASATRPSAPPKSSQSAAESTVNQVTEPSESAVAAPSLRRSTRNKRSRAISTDNPSEDLATLRSKRRKASPPVDVRPVPQESTSNAVLPPTSTPPVIPVVASSSLEGPSLSTSQRVQRPDSIDLWGPRSRFQDQILEASAATSNPAQAAASSSDPSTTSNQSRPEEPFNLWTARFPMGVRREHDLIPSQPSSSQVGFSQPSDVDSLGPSSPAQIASFGLGQSAATSLGQSTTSSSQPPATAFSQPAMSPSQPTASSSQPTADSSQPSQPRRPAPLKRSNERLVINSDGTFEIINLTSSSQPPATAFNQPAMSPSQPTASSSQPTADSSQPSQPRRPAPLRRTHEQLVMNSDGTLEIIDTSSLSHPATTAFNQPAMSFSQPTASSSQLTTSSSQPTTSSSQPTTSSSQPTTSSSQPTTSSSQPTTSSSQPATSSSQPATTSSSQPTADSSQPSQPRRPAPLRRTNERLVMNSDGTLEIINYDTPERIAEGEEIVRDAQRRGHRYTLSQISELCAPRYPFLFAGKSEDSYHSICPPSPRAGW